MSEFAEVAAARTRKERLVFYVAATAMGLGFLLAVLGLLAREVVLHG